MSHELERGELTREQAQLADQLVAAMVRERAVGRIEVEFGADLQATKVWRHQVFPRRRAVDGGAGH